MQLNKRIYLILLISFHLINGAVQINNFEEVSIEGGTTEFEYDFISPTLQEEKDAYFFFRFINTYETKLTIKDGDNNTTEIEIDNDRFYFYKIENLKSQKFTFIIENPFGLSSLQSTEEMSMLFLDNSKEINFDLDKFSKFKFETKDIYIRPPLPLIFKVDSFQIEKAIIFFVGTGYDSSDYIYIYDGNSTIEYCVINNDKCNYASVNDKLILEKGKKYKIKYNCFKFEKYDIYVFHNNEIRIIIKEVGLGYNQMLIDRHNFIIFDATKVDDFFLYVKCLEEYYLTTFITQEERNKIEEDTENLNKISEQPSKHQTNEIKYFEKKNKEYMLVYIESDYENRKGVLYFFNTYIQLQNEQILEMEKGTYGLFTKYMDYYKDSNLNYAISSNKTMRIINSNSNFNINELTNLIYLNNNEDYDYDIDKRKILYIYADSSKQKTKYKFSDSIFNNMDNLKLINEANLRDYFNNYGPDSLFMRTSFSHIDYNFYSLYFFGLEEQYYFYIKKYFGNIDFYKYKKELDIFSYVEGNYDEYELINSKIINVTGFQIYSFYNSYGSLYDLYFQKVNDIENIQINLDMFLFGNLVKLLKANKKYYLDFKVDHLIKLDNDFLDSKVEFTQNENKFILNKDKKIIKDLKGEGITVQADKDTLIYFYKKIEEIIINKIHIIEFDKSKKGQNMQFNITNKDNMNVNIKIAKDFGFEGYYPMLRTESWNIINSQENKSIIYIENLYDKLKTELNEEEKLYIYIIDNFDSERSFSEKYLLTEPNYFNNLFNNDNSFNFQIIPKNPQGSIIFSIKNKELIQYKLLTCENEKIKFKIELSSLSNDFMLTSTVYPNEYEITKKDENNVINLYLQPSDILSHSFESEKEFLFSYMFSNSDAFCINKLNYFSIISIDEASKNILKVKFSPVYENCLSQYYIIIGKKDNNNYNIQKFTDPCYISKILSQNPEDLVIKNFNIQKSRKYEDYENYVPLITFVDIRKLNADENTEFVATILGYNSFDLYKPIEFILAKKYPIEFKIGEEVEYNVLNDKLFFKFDYINEVDLPKKIYFKFGPNIGLYLIFIDNINSVYEINYNGALIEITLTKSGTYYFEIYSPIGFIYPGKFKTFIPEKLIDTIDLTQKMYYGDISVRLDTKLGPSMYNVKNLKDDTVVYFTYKIQDEDEEYYEYDEDTDENSIISPFVICKFNTSECEKNVTTYTFKEGNEYTIYINFIEKIEKDWVGIHYFYYYPSYSFFPITNTTIEEKEEGFYLISEPKIYLINIKNKGKLFLHSENENQILLSYSNDKDISKNLANLKFEKITDLQSISEESDYNFGIIMIIPSMNTTTKFIMANLLIDNDNKKEIVVPAGKNALFIVENILDNKDTLTTKKNLRKMKVESSEEGEEEEDNWDDKKDDSDYYEEEEEEEREKKEEKDEEDEDKNKDDSEDGIDYNILTTFSSEGKYMRFVGDDDLNKKYDFITQNTYPFPIYVDKNDKEIKIKIKTYKPRYALFFAINNNLLDSYFKLLSEMLENSDADLLAMLLQFPLNLRINTDIFNFDEFFNLYLYKSEVNSNIYIKNLYGHTDFYECDADSIDNNDLSIITKPINNCKNKRSILNRIFNLNGTKLITGHFDHNSYMDIYFDFNDNTNTIKRLPLYMGLYRNIFKYLKKDKEYILDFDADHLIKLEPGFNAIISIYDNKGKNYTINTENPTVEIQGKNFKILSNNDAIVYFYGKIIENLNEFRIKQYKLEFRNGENIEIKFKESVSFTIDFGFEGYFLNDYMSLFISDIHSEGILYKENINEKLKTTLVDGEELYLYYLRHDVDEDEDEDRDDDKGKLPFEITYSPSLNNPKNEYNFNVIPRNSGNKSLVINNYEADEIMLRIDFCNSSHNVKIIYHPGELEKVEETEFEFNNTETVKNIEDLARNSFKLTFESEHDFIFSYSYFVEGDSLISDNEEWLEERKELENLVINEVNINYLGIISINFNPNYKASSTRYIIVVAPKNDKYTKEVLSNHCSLTEIVTNNNEDVKIVNLIDTGENEVISVNVDIYDLLQNNNDFIIGIISQEIRFEKKINFYELYEFTNDNQEMPVEINIEEETGFNLDDKSYFDLVYEKKSQENEMLLLNYELKEETPISIKIIGENGIEYPFEINNKEGYVNFLCDKSGHYRIKFEQGKSAKLRRVSSIDEGVFKILSTENPFNIDITKNNIEFDEFNIARSESISLKLIIDNLEKDYTKKISIANIGYNDIDEIVSIQKNNEEYKPLNFPYYTFEKNNTYNISINFNKKGNEYTLEKTNIIDYSFDIKEFSKGNIVYEHVDDIFLIIDWSGVKQVAITIKKNNAKIYLSQLSESEAKSKTIKIFQNLKFTILDDLTINKPSDSKFSLLCIGLFEKGTEIEFDIVKDDNDNEDDGGISTLAIVFISVLGFLIFVIIIFFIIRHCKKKNSEDFEGKAQQLENEKLMSDI